MSLNPNTACAPPSTPSHQSHSAQLRPRSAREWQRAVGRYATPSWSVAAFELATTLALVGAGYAVSYFAWSAHWLAGLASAPLPAIALVRLFVIQHDCGHRAFFASKRANDFAGRFLSLFTLFPYDQWRQNHAKHHAAVGNLEKRGAGDVKTITSREYETLSRLDRLAYRLYRDPILMFGLGGAYYTLVRNRLPRQGIGNGWFSRLASSQSLNVLILIAALAAYQLGLLGEILRVALPAISLGGSLGIAFFFSGHQFEDTHWSSEPRWNLLEAAFRGSSHLDLPSPLAWLTGHIGAHHVHHLNSRIPMYRLGSCLRENPELASHNRLTLRDAVGSTSLSLWDEDRNKLVRIRG